MSNPRTALQSQPPPCRQSQALLAGESEQPEAVRAVLGTGSTAKNEGSCMMTGGAPPTSFTTELVMESWIR